MNNLKLSDVHQLNKKNLFVIGWFAGIFTFINFIIVYLAFKQFSDYDSVSFYSSVIFIFVFITALSLGSLIAWIVFLIGMFGKVSKVDPLDLIAPIDSDFHIKETKITTLWGFEFGRENVGEWKEIALKGAFKISEGEIPWSYSVVGEESKNQKDDERRAIKLLHVAVWKLVEMGLVGMRARKESGSLLLNKFKGSTQLSIYFYRNEKILDQKILGRWENLLFEKINEATYEKPLDLKSWVIEAFGDSKQLPMKYVLHVTEKELVEQGYGTFKGMILKTFIPSGHELISKKSMESIVEYIKSYDSALNGLYDACEFQIKKGLKNRVSSD
ncbi:MAG: hypothetical protein K2Q18_10615 [Bdellovibrionales bacterium]|nr:hypothetical protein [Bdellovibrionales bacterium]